MNIIISCIVIGLFYYMYKFYLKRKKEKEEWDDILKHKNEWKREAHTGFSTLYSYNGKWIERDHNPFAHEYNYHLLTDEQARVYKKESW